MVFVWVCRAAITFIEPWPLEPMAWAAYLQQIITFVILFLQTIPLIYLTKRINENNKFHHL
jgi:hypothetical protein